MCQASQHSVEFNHLNHSRRSRETFFRATVYTNHGPKLVTVSNQDSSGFELRARNADLLVFRLHLKIDRFTQHASNRQPNFCRSAVPSARTYRSSQSRRPYTSSSTTERQSAGSTSAHDLHQPATTTVAAGTAKEGYAAGFVSHHV